MMCRSPINISTRFYNYRELKDYTARGSGIAAVPCGSCKNCRINQARIWTNRILLEQTCHNSSIFVTLTYDDDHLPSPPDVSKLEVRNFLRKLRYRIDPHKFRYFACGEYGEKGTRVWNPHYHIIFFGLDESFSESIYSSWKKCDRDNGFHVGELNKDSARYITGYVVKKINKHPALDCHPVNFGLTDEFVLASKKGGAIGYPAIMAIANKLKKNPHWKNRYISTVKRGDKGSPLGRYLSGKLMELLGVEEKMILENFWFNQELYFMNCDRGMKPEKFYMRSHKL